MPPDAAAGSPLRRSLERPDIRVFDFDQPAEYFLSLRLLP